MECVAVKSKGLIEQDLARTRVVSHPLRFRIFMHLMKGTASVKEVAGAMDVSPTKLYYHFKLLEEQELIRVASTRVVSGIIESQYEATPGRYRVPSGSSGVTSVVQEAFSELSASLANDVGGPLFHWWTGGMSAKRQKEFRRRLIALVKELGNETDDASRGQSVGMILALYPSKEPP